MMFSVFVFLHAYVGYVGVANTCSPTFAHNDSEANVDPDGLGMELFFIPSKSAGAFQLDADTVRSVSGKLMSFF